MNARLRSIFFTASLITAAFSAVTYTSCAEEKCKPVVCASGGTCVDGACICPSGYEGARCETLNRERFKGVWSVEEDGSISSKAAYGVSIEYGSGITDVLIRNFNNSIKPEDVAARIKGDTIYIDPQTFRGQTVTGIGYISDSKFYGVNARLVMRYRIVKSNGQIDNFGFDPGSSNYSTWDK